MKADTDKLRIVVIGSGGIGSYFGAHLQAAGHRVVFVARAAHLAALQKNGLRVDHPHFQFAQPVDATDLPGLLADRRAADFDLVMICTKADATESMAAALAHWFAATNAAVAVLSLQNGVDNEKILATALGPHVVIGGLAVRIGAHVAAPGCIDATGVGEIILGLWPNQSEYVPGIASEMIPQCIAAFRDAKVPVEQSPDIRRELWRKLVINNGVNPLSTLVQQDTRTLTHDAAYIPIIKGMMEEAARAAAAEGVELDATDVNEMFALISEFDAIKTSMLIDWEKNRPMEIDAICGVVLKRSAKLGIDAPYTRTVAALLERMAPLRCNRN